MVRRFVELSCSASNIPEKLQYDLNDSEIGDAVKISNIVLPEGVEPTIMDRDFVVATLVPPTIEVEEEKPEEEGEGAEGAEGAEDAEVAEGEAEGAEGEGKEEKSQDKNKKEDKKEEPTEKKSK